MVRFRRVETLSSDLPSKQRPRPVHAAGDEAHFFEDVAMDRFVAVVMNLAQEVWRQEERLMRLEGRQGNPDAEAKAFVDRVFAPVREPREIEA